MVEINLDNKLFSLWEVLYKSLEKSIIETELRIKFLEEYIVLYSIHFIHRVPIYFFKKYNVEVNKEYVIDNFNFSNKTLKLNPCDNSAIEKVIETYIPNEKVFDIYRVNYNISYEDIFLKLFELVNHKGKIDLDIVKAIHRYYKNQNHYYFTVNNDLKSPVVIFMPFFASIEVIILSLTNLSNFDKFSESILNKYNKEVSYDRNLFL